MANKVSFSGKERELALIALHHQDTVESVKAYFSQQSPQFTVRFAGYTSAEVTAELLERLEELEFSSSLTALAALEAAFRVDYLQRCYTKRKDDLSRAFRALYKTYETRVSLDEQIFEAWKEQSDVSTTLIGQIRSAFKFRHWLAHGRYWQPKFGRDYDYSTIYLIVDLALKSFPFEGRA